MDRRYSYNWLAEYVALPNNPQTFASEFSLKSQTIDRLTPFKPVFSKLVAAKITAIDPHPNADKLRLVTVDYGSGTQQVVCGAPNIQIGQIIAFAQEGATLLDPHDITKTTTLTKAVIRGVESAGMVCGLDELGLGSEHYEVLTLPDDTKLGVPLEKLLPSADHVMDIEITSNRPDAMSIVGLARETSAIFGKPLKLEVSQPKFDLTNELPLTVSVESSNLCPRYQAVVVDNVTIQPSPLWLQLRLMQAGIRPINNIVDITNYVLLEFGQPMHAFDYEKIIDKKIIVRPATKGEKLFALDGQTYQLKPETLVIADGKRPIAIAGVMGGQDTSVTNQTKTIVFEAANFEPVSVRKTARALNLFSESSSLFEKGLQPEGTFSALLRAMSLAQEIAQGVVRSPIIDIYASAFVPQEISFDPAIVSRRLGVPVGVDVIVKTLTALGFGVKGKQILTLTIPWWRTGDIAEPHDVVEEVARMYGYNKIPAVLPTGSLPHEPIDKRFDQQYLIKSLLADIGFTELYTYSMVSESLLAADGFKPTEAIQIANPLTEEMTHMRRSILPQVLEVIGKNQGIVSEQKVFELSNVYEPAGKKALPRESLELVIGVSRSAESFRLLKGVCSMLFRRLGVAEVTYKSTDEGHRWQKQQVLEISSGRVLLGQMGVLDAKLLQRFGIKQAVTAIVLDVEKVIQYATGVQRFTPIPQYPGAERDVAVIVDVDTTWEVISDAVRKSSPLVVEVEFLSVFTNQKFGENKKSVALRLTIRSDEKTLTTQEIDAAVDAVVKNLKEKVNAIIR